MKLSDIVSLGTIVGGFAGLLSFIFVVWERVARKPKLVTSIRRAVFRNEGGEPYGVEARLSLQVSVEVGNLGSEPTTITRIKLVLSDGQELETKGVHQSSNGFGFIVDDYNTRVCEKGMAFVEHLNFYGKQMSKGGEKIDGRIVFTLIGGATHKVDVSLNEEKS